VDQYIHAENASGRFPGWHYLWLATARLCAPKATVLSNVELQVPVKPETLFQSGSIGKQFTATAVMMLVEEGKDWVGGSAYQNIFRTRPLAWKQVTVHQLLSHTAGFTDYPAKFNFRRDHTEDELLK